ncbi:MAG: hypothetical protein D6812_12170 [Deltaproteobacteria bacterium]|nr:MAG: hypothetical protein D6812_12170 [Deltaproteobacteria bacterium]
MTRSGFKENVLLIDDPSSPLQCRKETSFHRLILSLLCQLARQSHLISPQDLQSRGNLKS